MPVGMVSSQTSPRTFGTTRPNSCKRSMSCKSRFIDIDIDIATGGAVAIVGTVVGFDVTGKGAGVGEAVATGGLKVGMAVLIGAGDGSKVVTGDKVGETVTTEAVFGLRLVGRGVSKDGIDVVDGDGARVIDIVGDRVGESVVPNGQTSLKGGSSPVNSVHPAL